MCTAQRFFLLTPLLPLVLCKGASSPKPSALGYPVSNHTIPLIPPWKEYEEFGLFAAEVFVGSRVFALGIDTGSSDTWVLAKDVNCTNVVTLQPVPPAECGYTGPRFDPDSPSFEVIPDVHLNESFANSARLNGQLGYTELVLGGLTIPKQEIGAISYAATGGISEGNVSGLVGLAHASYTNAFPGTDPFKDIRCKGNSSCGPIPYSPIIESIFQDPSIEPVFSFALSRSSTFGGVMTIGGIPRLDEAYINATKAVTATSPIIPLGNTTVPNFYSTEVEILVYSNATTRAGQGRYLLDTGTIPNVFPKEEADAINALFVPPAVLNRTTGSYEVPCDASPPELGISIGGQVFYHNPKDMIIEYGGICRSAVRGSASPESVPILGATWMKNVLAVFDVGASEMTFVGRTYYEDS